MKNTSFQAVVLAVFSALATSLSHGAEITWEPVQNVTGELTDFSDNGTFHFGYSGDTFDVTVDMAGLNLTFTSAQNLANGVFNDADPVDRTNFDYDTLLQNATFGNDGGTETIELGLERPLFPGILYEVQVWIADTRGCCNNRTKTVSDGVGNNVELNSGATDGTLTNYVIGTFTADASTQILEFIDDPNDASRHRQYNAIMVRQISTPDDSDNDMIPDAWELSFAGITDLTQLGGIPAENFDFDDDGLNDLAENVAETDPTLNDSDGDGFYDGAETNDGTFDSYNFTTNRGDTGTDPNNLDTDGDGLWDGAESNTGTFVSYDFDLNTGDTGTNPLELDSDGDFWDDDFEIVRNSDPTDINSVPIFNNIVWEEPQDITGTLADFNIGGDLVEAWNGGGNEVFITGLNLTFEVGPALSVGVFQADANVTHSDADYDELLRQAAWGQETQSIFIDGLTIGEEYTIQIWLADTRPDSSNREKTYGTFEADQVILNSGSVDGQASQFVVGTFTANDTRQELTFFGGSDSDHPQYNAITVRTGKPVFGDPPPVESERIVISSISFIDETTTQITWESEVGVEYTVDYSTTLMDADWMGIADVMGMPGQTSFDDEIADRGGNPQIGFYRVRLNTTTP